VHRDDLLCLLLRLSLKISHPCLPQLLLVYSVCHAFGLCVSISLCLSVFSHEVLRLDLHTNLLGRHAQQVKLLVLPCQSLQVLHALDPNHLQAVNHVGKVKMRARLRIHVVLVLSLVCVDSLVVRCGLPYSQPLTEEQTYRAMSLVWGLLLAKVKFS